MVDVLRGEDPEVVHLRVEFDRPTRGIPMRLVHVKKIELRLLDNVRSAPEPWNIANKLLQKLAGLTHLNLRVLVGHDPTIQLEDLLSELALSGVKMHIRSDSMGLRTIPPRRRMPENEDRGPRIAYGEKEMLWNYYTPLILPTKYGLSL